MTRVFVDYNGFEFIKRALKKPPETCGNMNVDFIADSYYLSDFREEYYDRSDCSCTPISRPSGGVWHTHPPNMPKASERDIKTMEQDLISAINADTPGIPPLSLIASLTNGKPTITVYIPTFELKMDEEKVPHSLNSLPVKFTLPPWMRGKAGKKFMYHFLLFKVEEKLDKLTEKSYYEIQEFLTLHKSNVKDSDGIFIGSKVPIHVIPVLISYFAKHSGKKSFLVLKECSGLFNVSLDYYRERIIEARVDVSSPKFGYEQRLKLISDLNLQKLRDYKIALFGAGFLGTQIAGALAKYFKEIAVVDDDFVGYENVGYQEYYTLEDVNTEKVYALAKNLENMHPQVKMYGIKTHVPNFDVSLPRIIEEIVNWADCIITAFDTIHPRLTLQVACSKYSKPLIDAGVGTHDGTITVWLPETDYSCIGCYAYFNTKPSKNVYASDPAIARLIASIITRVCIKLARREKVPNLIDIDLKNISMSSDNWKRNDDCPFCSTKIKFKISLEDNVELIIECDREKTIYEFEKNLLKLLGIDTKINYASGRYTDFTIDIPKKSNLILLKVLERQGLKLYITKNKT